MDWDTPVIDERDLARTYDGGAYSDPWAAVLDYQAVLRYASQHPDKGSYAISNALEFPRGRVRGWTDGGKPDAARGIEIARDYGWLDATMQDGTFLALNTLVANVFSGGSIAIETFTPSFALNHRDHRSHVIDALEGVGVEHEFYHEDDDSRSTEVRPTVAGSVLGRTLAVLGAPVGPKARLEDFTLPWYLDEAPFEVREMFVLAYLANRAIHQRTKETVQIQEERDKSYRDELAALIEDVAKEPVTSGERMVTISADAARSLGLQPRYRTPTGTTEPSE
ncbi:hypothetical protein [Natronorubrum sulfidifaciens]|uniref:Uncharacterized protein n=1 Tax=Natronorubrum sulfidifaciens JCM 14089 TaxID=1230460 RepID=L9W2L6_9EURY|nr:hypothetical protein [Natronorubrum sulfidifaciens]ELY42558.1 hypothetical protein C495_14632 [Natronorubrum sulfidifaciens JCM 14089]